MLQGGSCYISMAEDEKRKETADRVAYAIAGLVDEAVAGRTCMERG